MRKQLLWILIAQEIGRDRTARVRVCVKTPLSNRSLAVAARKVLHLALESKPSRAREQAVFEFPHRLVSKRTRAKTRGLVH